MSGCLEHGSIMGLKPSAKIGDKHNIEFITEIPDKSVEIMADSMIEEVLFNIYHNSAKFQRPGKSVIETKINLKEKEGRIVIDVADHGHGINDEQKKGLFERFERSTDRSHSGIGLSLVKVLVDRYNGTIRVEDRIPFDHTQGLRVIVSFPIRDQI